MGLTAVMGVLQGCCRVVTAVCMALLGHCLGLHAVIGVLQGHECRYKSATEVYKGVAGVLQGHHGGIAGPAREQDTGVYGIQISASLHSVGTNLLDVAPLGMAQLLRFISHIALRQVGRCAARDPTPRCSWAGIPIQCTGVQCTLQEHTVIQYCAHSTVY